MKLSTACKLAIASMEKEIKSINFDANLHDQMNATYPRAINASKKRKRLQTAIRTLQVEITREKSPRQLDIWNTGKQGNKVHG